MQWGWLVNDIDNSFRLVFIGCSDFGIGFIFHIHSVAEGFWVNEEEAASYLCYSFALFDVSLVCCNEEVFDGTDANTDFEGLPPLPCSARRGAEMLGTLSVGFCRHMTKGEQ